MAAIKFPDLVPSSRSYRPGQRPETTFQSQDGAVSFIRFGHWRVDSELQMEFRNLRDEWAAEIIDVYNQSQAEDDSWIFFPFTDKNALSGMHSALLPKIENGSGILRYRFDGPPQLTSVYPGITTVSCQFIGRLYAA